MSKKRHGTQKIVLRGGCGSDAIPIVRQVVPKKDKAQKAIDKAHAIRDDKDSADAEKEAQAMKQHKAIRPDKQKLAF